MRYWLIAVKHDCFNVASGRATWTLVCFHQYRASINSSIPVQIGPLFHLFFSTTVFSCCKTFFGKYIFSGNANFRKRKTFPCVWLHFKKFSEKYFLVFGKEEGKHKSRKTQATTQIQSDDKSSPTTAPSIAIRDRDQRRDRDLAFFARSRSSRDRNQRRLECLPARSRSARTGARSLLTIVGLIGMFLLLSRVRALSLSL